MSTPREDTDPHYYEGLVRATALMYYGRLGAEVEDLEQVLRIRVWIALEAYADGRGTVNRRKFVFHCVRNQIRDLVKSRMRRKNARPDWMAEPIREVYLADVAPDAEPFHDPFETHVEDAVALPVTLTEDERRVLALVYVGHSLTEASSLLGVKPRQVGSWMSSIRIKMADWHPGSPAPAVQGAEIVQLASEAWELLEAA